MAPTKKRIPKTLRSRKFGISDTCWICSHDFLHRKAKGTELADRTCRDEEGEEEPPDKEEHEAVYDHELRPQAVGMAQEQRETEVDIQRVHGCWEPPLTGYLESEASLPPIFCNGTRREAAGQAERKAEWEGVRCKALTHPLGTDDSSKGHSPHNTRSRVHDFP